VSASSTRPPTRRLAINRLRDRKPLDAAAVDRFIARHEVPIVEGPRCTFLYRGEADQVFLAQRIVGLPELLPLRPLRGTDLWFLVLELPEGSRVNYQLEVRRGDHVERINDPLNEKLSYSPVGTSSVCFGHGYESPEWTMPNPDARPGELVDLTVRSRALRADRPVTVYLPAHRVVPPADRPRRAGLPPVRRRQDRAGQPDPPARRRGDGGRLSASAGPAHRVRQLDEPLALPDQRAAAPAGDRAATRRQAVGAMPDGLELRGRRLVVGSRAGA
jgi:hypothetical protein